LRWKERKKREKPKEKPDTPLGLKQQGSGEEGNEVTPRERRKKH